MDHINWSCSEATPQPCEGEDVDFVGVIVIVAAGSRLVVNWTTGEVVPHVISHRFVSVELALRLK